MRNCILALTLLISPMAMFAQHNNKIIFDEMVNQSILYGEVNPEDFQNELFGLWYNEGFENYQPNAEVVDQIKPLLKNVTFELIVATWCPDSKRETPRFIKLLNTKQVQGRDRRCRIPDNRLINIALRFCQEIIEHKSRNKGGK